MQEKNTNPVLEDAGRLHKLIPNLSGQQRVENSVAHAERNGDDIVRGNSERRIGAHLVRLTELLRHEGVEARVWDSAVEELIIKPENIPEYYWEQQKQIARDEGLGDIHLGHSIKDQLASELQEAQRTGLQSWRDYLELAGDQYPLWFKFYAWDGMSHLGTFDKAKGHYSKRSSGTVAPYPQLNPAVLVRVFEAVKDQGGDDQSVAKLVKSGNFNKLYSHMLLDQKAVIPTPENPEDIHGEWREYSSDNIEAIIEAAEGTPWCIAGRSMAELYTRGGGKFLLFHLQDPETGKTSPTAAASVRLDDHGQVAELSGLKGGARQYVEDSLVPIVQEKVNQLPGGENYLQAFDDKQMLIRMDRKFQKGEPFSHEEIMFLYEVERPITYMDTYAEDPRPNHFKRARDQHMQQLTESGIDAKEAKLMLTSTHEIEENPDLFLRQGYDPNIIAKRLSPEARFRYLDSLMEAGAQVDLNELYNQLETKEQLRVFSELHERGASIDPDELAGKFTPLGQLTNYHALAEIGASITPNDVANAFSDRERFNNLWDLSKIGAKIDVDQLIKDLQPRLDKNRIAFYLKEGAKLETIQGMFELDLTFGSSDLRHTTRQLVESGLSGDEIMSFLTSAKRMNGKGFGQGDDNRDPIGVLLSAGVEPDAIIRSNIFGSSGINHKIAELLSAGADPNEIMSRLGAFYTGKNIDEMLKAGAQIGDIVSHMQADPRCILDHFEKLNENGANLSIEDLVAVMDTKDVLYNIAKVKRLGSGIDVNHLLDSPDVDYVYLHRIDDMLEAGADPNKIAAKISPIDIGYNFNGQPDSHPSSTTKSFQSEYPKIYDLARSFYERSHATAIAA
jgi:hypothetical protein